MDIFQCILNIILLTSFDIFPHINCGFSFWSTSHPYIKGLMRRTPQWSDFFIYNHTIRICAIGVLNDQFFVQSQRHPTWDIKKINFTLRGSSKYISTWFQKSHLSDFWKFQFFNPLLWMLLICIFHSNFFRIFQWKRAQLFFGFEIKNPNISIWISNYSFICYLEYIHTETFF